jgi:hypothetical protein
LIDNKLKLDKRGKEFQFRAVRYKAGLYINKIYVIIAHAKQKDDLFYSILDGKGAVHGEVKLLAYSYPINELKDCVKVGSFLPHESEIRWRWIHKNFQEKSQ